jgi:AcrR family transcriptional regulator
MSPPRRSPESTEELRSELIDHALRIIGRDGPEALTMRALAAEADCAVGLPYKVFADRRDLVHAVLRRELDELDGVIESLMARAGRHSVGANLAWFADEFLASPAAPLVREEIANATDMADLHGSAAGMHDLEAALGRYLAAERDASRVRADVDVDEIGALVAGAIHNLVVAGAAWPRPSGARLRRRLDALATALAP